MPTVFRKEELETDEAFSCVWVIKYLGWAALLLVLAMSAVFAFAVRLAYNYWPSLLEFFRGFSLIAKS